MSSEEDVFSDFYYPDEVVTENEGNVDYLHILHHLCQVNSPQVFFISRVLPI